jgi:beta-glucosidase
MKFKIVFILIFVTFSGVIKAQEKPLYKDAGAPVEERIEDLIQLMTLEEKVMQMNQWTYGKNANPNNIGDKMKVVQPEIGSLIYRSVNPAYRNQIQKKAMEESRLGIPIICGFDVIHGYRTIFPIPLAQACAWDAGMVRKSCEVAAKEAWLSGVDWTFSPMVDVARDPRWGRVAEGYGEDPYANAVFGVAAVKGYQGENLAEKYTIAACLKHYVGYSLSEGGRDYRYSDVSDQTLWETFMLPYEAGVKAGAATLMSAFNDISGVPASANYYTLTKVLKEDWKHDGFVVSDWGSVENLINQGVAKDKKEAGMKAFLSGVEMDMVDNIYVDYLPELVEEGKVSMEAIDEAVRRILRIKFRLGLFEQPYVDVVPEKERYLRPEYLELAADIAAESMVLLKNDNQTLPLDESHRKLAVIGPMLEDSVNIMGSWEGMGQPGDVETLLEGMTREFGASKLLYTKGCDFDGNDTTGFAAARKVALESDAVVLFLGEKKRWSGENGIRANIALPDIQEQLVAAMKATGKPVILVLSNGRPLELMRIEKMADAMLEIWQPGTAGATAVAGILSGRINPSGKLSITFPQTTGQIPMYYNMRTPARPTMGHYQDIPKEPLYWFGHGLSYTSFDYQPVQLSSEKIRKDQKLHVEVTVKNTGDLDGKKSVLWYITDPVATISRPRKALKFFDKKMITAGEKAVYTFEIDPMRDLSYSDSKGNRHLETGDFYIWVGNQKVKFELVD